MRPLSLPTSVSLIAGAFAALAPAAGIHAAAAWPPQDPRETQARAHLHEWRTLGIGRQLHHGTAWADVLAADIAWLLAGVEAGRRWLPGETELPASYEDQLRVPGVIT